MKYKTVRCILDKYDRYLLAQHNNHRPETIGKWGLPGGHIDKGEDFLTTVNREILEEFKIELSHWQEIADYNYLKSLHKVFATRYSGTSKLNFDKKEILAIRWVNFEELQELSQKDMLHTGFELAAVSKYRKNFKKG